MVSRIFEISEANTVGPAESYRTLRPHNQHQTPCLTFVHLDIPFHGGTGTLEMNRIQTINSIRIRIFPHPPPLVGPGFPGGLSTPPWS